ncbi:zf-HC2 domain-containing protein [Paenibacillus sp.]|uniref:anti-sigma factor family protein n=1 Tax=Paenibacillus sp. TaxID=58172 RepID=UPI0006D1AD93
MMCQEVIELMQRYLDRDLEETEYRRMLGHLQQCPDCSELFERLVNLSTELENLPKVTPPFSLVDAIMPSIERLDAASGSGEAVWTSTATEESASQDAERTTARELPKRTRRMESWRQQVREWVSFPVLGGVVAAGLIFGFFIFQQDRSTTGNLAESLSSKAEQKAAADQAAAPRAQPAGNAGGANETGQVLNDGNAASGGSSGGSPAAGEAKGAEQEVGKNGQAETLNPAGAGEAAPTGKPNATKAAPSAPDQKNDAPQAGAGTSEQLPATPPASQGTADETPGGSAGTEEPAVPDSEASGPSAAKPGSAADGEAELHPREKGGPSFGFMAINPEPAAVHELSSSDNVYHARVEANQVVIRDAKEAEVYRSKFDRWEDAARIELVEWSSHKLIYTVQISDRKRTFEINMQAQSVTETEVKMN